MAAAAGYKAIGANGKNNGQVRAGPVFFGLALAILTAVGCGNPTGVPERETVSGVRYTSTPSLSGDTPFVLIDSVVVKNISGHTKSFSSGVCPMSIRAYRSADRSGGPVYDQGPPYPCIAPVVEWQLAPDSSTIFVESVSAARLRAAGVPPGHYWFAAVLSLNGGVIELAAGDASFSR